MSFPVFDIAFCLCVFPPIFPQKKPLHVHPGIHWYTFCFPAHAEGRQSQSLCASVVWQCELRSCCRCCMSQAQVGHFHCYLRLIVTLLSLLCPWHTYCMDMACKLWYLNWFIFIILVNW